MYATTSNEDYSVGGGLEGLRIQRAIKACLCSTGDGNNSDTGDINRGEPDKTTSVVGLPDIHSDYDEDSTGSKDATNTIPLTMGEVRAMPWSL